MDDRIRYTFSFSIDRDPAGFAILALVLLVWTIAWWTIFAKSGSSGLFGLLMMIPVINVIVFFMFAFGSWPIRKELRDQKARSVQLEAGGGSDVSNA